MVGQRRMIQQLFPPKCKFFTTSHTTEAPEAMMIPRPEGQVDEDEWAAFESDIATAEAQVQAANDAVISAPAMSAAELTKKSAEEDYAQKKERQEAELEGTRKMLQGRWRKIWRRWRVWRPVSGGYEKSGRS